MNHVLGREFEPKIVCIQTQRRSGTICYCRSAGVLCRPPAQSASPSCLHAAGSSGWPAREPGSASRCFSPELVVVVVSQYLSQAKLFWALLESSQPKTVAVSHRAIFFFLKIFLFKLGFGKGASLHSASRQGFLSVGSSWGESLSDNHSGWSSGWPVTDSKASASW